MLPRLLIALDASHTISLAFDPNEPRDNSGKWSESGNSKGKSKLQINKAAQMLSAKGYKLGQSLPWKPGDKTVSYNVTHSKSGETRQLTADQIKKLI